MWRWRISFPVLLGVGLLIVPAAAQDQFQSPKPEPAKPTQHHAAHPPKPNTQLSNPPVPPPAQPIPNTQPNNTGGGTIAWDPDTGRYGVSWNQPTTQLADQAALRDCGGCKVVMRFGPATCAAFATTQNFRHVGAAARSDRDAASFAALLNCNKGGAGPCVLRTTACNR
jgi:hypothetical protein